MDNFEQLWPRVLGILGQIYPGYRKLAQSVQTQEPPEHPKLWMLRPKLWILSTSTVLSALANLCVCGGVTSLGDSHGELSIPSPKLSLPQSSLRELRELEIDTRGAIGFRGRP